MSREHVPCMGSHMAVSGAIKTWFTSCCSEGKRVWDRITTAGNDQAQRWMGKRGRSEALHSLESSGQIKEVRLAGSESGETVQFFFEWKKKIWQK